ncbi:hypothetical protein WBJ53_18035 [Spirosoma sp. SC4-14]|uniref:hypothetical protein n=1 Tax=Spirosoma sp. SC4-14 TaxID=3128900 RepID=UPI0030D21061
METISCLAIAVIALALQGCPSDVPVNNAPAGYAYGTFEWDSTITPTRVLTPNTIGYSQKLKVRRNGYNDLAPASVSFYRNDTLQRRYFEPVGDSAEVKELDNKNVLIKYILPGPGSTSTTAYIHYRVETTDKATTLIVSEFLNPYLEKADTVHHYYRMIALTPITYPLNN